VVARVHGAALGGGAGLVAASDIAVADERGAQIGFSEVRLGIVPATIAPHVIAKIGPGAALPLFLTGERLSAAEARAIGLVHRVAEEGRLDVEVADIVQQLLAGGPDAQGTCKELVRRVAGQGWGPGLREGEGIDTYTSELIARVRAGEEAREGIAAFLEKRKPGWAADR
jgi:methylglutaconyl-CoA hydratase